MLASGNSPKSRGVRFRKAYLRFRSQGLLQVFAIMGFLYLVVFCYLPMFGLQIAFRDYKPTMGLAGFFTAPITGNGGFYHFKTFFNDPDFGIIMRNTLLLSLLKLAFSFPVPILFALAINEMRGTKIKRVVQTVSYLPHFISWVIVYGLVFTFLNTSNGVVNEVLHNLGQKKLEFLTTSDYYWPMAVITDVWKEMGWWSIIFLAAMTGIDPSQYESARVDGASRLKCICHITLPNIKGTIMVVLILSIGSLLSGGMGGSNFDQSFLFGNTVNYSRSITLPYYIYKMGLTKFRFSYATAVGLFQSVISLLLVLTSNAVSKRTTGNGFF
jgi:putative aldouronate transport system permease protein